VTADAARIDAEMTPMFAPWAIYQAKGLSLQLARMLAATLRHPGTPSPRRLTLARERPGDAPDISGLHRLGELPLLLRLLAARNCSELNVASLAGDSGVPVRTLGRH
jgi:hypothetical protein